MDNFTRLIDSSIGYLVGRTSRAIVKRLTKKFQDFGYDISYEQWSILIHLYRKDGRTQQDLARTAVKDKAAITRLINGLEKKNIVNEKELFSLGKYSPFHKMNFNCTIDRTVVRGEQVFDTRKGITAAAGYGKWIKRDG